MKKLADNEAYLNYINLAFGRVVTESMYTKRPVIIGANVDASDIIQNGVNGFIFEADKNRELNLAQNVVNGLYPDLVS